MRSRRRPTAWWINCSSRRARPWTPVPSSSTSSSYNNFPMSNQPLGPYVIGERVGTSVWLAEDTRNGKRVALKLLSKQLPKDEVRREALIREVRVAAALYHAFLVPILEITPIDDNLVMVMDVVEGMSVS